jgi:hypothetical protein
MQVTECFKGLVQPKDLHKHMLAKISSTATITETEIFKFIFLQKNSRQFKSQQIVIVHIADISSISYNPEYSHINLHNQENLKSYTNPLP